MKILVTGANGMIGSEVILQAQQEHQVIAVVREHATLPPVLNPHQVVVAKDYEETVTVAIHQSEPDVVIHCAAMTDVDLCEYDPNRAWYTNCNLTRVIAAACRDIETRMVLVSTDAVFGPRSSINHHATLAESDRTDPVNTYGLSKRAAEDTVWTMSKNYAVARVSNIYSSRTWARSNFGAKVVHNLHYKNQIDAWSDHVSSPTLASGAALRIIELALGKMQGFIHISDNVVLSRVEFAHKIAERFNLTHVIRPVPMHKAQLSALRMPWSPLNVNLAGNKLVNKPYTIDRALDIFYEEWCQRSDASLFNLQRGDKE